jgi:hypothetical protein
MSETDYASQLKIENNKLETEIQKKQSEFNVYGRVNDYYLQDEVLFVYIQKILTILYGAIYLFFIYFLYINQEKYGKPTIIFYLFIYALLPFTLHLVSRFLYSLFISVLHLFNNGNASYLYADPKVPTDS